MTPPNLDFHPKDCHRWIVKVGSNVLSDAHGRLNAARIKNLIAQIAFLRAQAIEVVLVSSGAVASGMGAMRLDARPTELPMLQALAAIGQGALMREYGDACAGHGIIPAQVLLTRGDMEDRRRYLNVRQTLSALLAVGALPIINENDTTTVDELKFGDNDMLSAMLAAKLQAPLLVLLTDVKGLHTGNPKKDPSSQLIRVVPRITADIESLIDPGRSRFGIGGMRTKIEAARHAGRFGAATVIARGSDDDILHGIHAGTAEATLILPPTGKGASARKHWILTRRARGSLAIDAGAVSAIRDRGKSLLPIGVRSVSGQFVAGDVVEILSPEGARVGLGISNYNSAIATRLAGHRIEDLRESIDHLDYEEVVHRDNMAVLVDG